jgi:micrococcal nuclease
MIKWIFSCCLLLNACLYQPDSGKTEDANEWREVVKIVDGDTFHLKSLTGGKAERVRLIGIDAPETRTNGKKVKHPFGPVSKAYLDDLLKDRLVRLEYDVTKKDQYGRTLAYVYLKDGTFVNAKMVHDGYAAVVTFPPNVRHAEYFYELQQKARADNLGMWSEEAVSSINE